MNFFLPAGNINSREASWRPHFQAIIMYLCWVRKDVLVTWKMLIPLSIRHKCLVIEQFRTGSTVDIRMRQISDTSLEPQWKRAVVFFASSELGWKTRTFFPSNRAYPQHISLLQGCTVWKTPKVAISFKVTLWFKMSTATNYQRSSMVIC